LPFWKRAESFGFQMPHLGSDNRQEFFPGTECVKLSGTRLMHELVQQCRELASSRYSGIPKPCLAVILVGDHPASEVYVAHKRKRFAECGFETRLVRVAEREATAAAIEAVIDDLNADSSVDGILMQLPLPEGIRSTPLLDRILPAKDVDGFHVLNTGYLASGRYSGLMPCTPFGIFTLLQSYGVPLEGRAVTVVGRSNIVGKPAAFMALNARATLSVVHKITKDIKPYTRMADVLIVGAGSHQLIRKDHVSPGVTIVDVGIHTTPSGKIEGDVHPEVLQIASAATPVPGGVGPMTIAMLCVNTAIACWSKAH
jgi:methylenetetrahydrofolate dehydrogenase (NADP+)/methenyltetrahydrofolate cyclohydrolase